MGRQVSVRLNRDVERFVMMYSRINNLKISESIRELLHFFKLIMNITNGMQELEKMMKEMNVRIIDSSRYGNGMKVNIVLNNSDIEFLDMVSTILGTNRSTALRFCIISLYHMLSILCGMNRH